MTDDPTDTTEGGSTASDDRSRALGEIAELAEHFGERLEAYEAADGGGITGPQRSLARDAMVRFTHNKLAVLSSIIMITFVIFAVLVPWDAAWNPLYSDAEASQVNYQESSLPPSAEHPFGTDPAGRDLWKRVWLGARVSLSIGLAVALMILIIGMVYGATSGYLGGRVDNGMMRLLDALYGLPYIPFAIIIVTVIRTNLGWENPLLYMVPAMCLTTWFTQARLTRGQILSLKENEFVESARSQGARSVRVIRRHLLPNTIGVTVVAIALEVPGAIMGEAILSVIGLGVQPPSTSWGRLAYDGIAYFTIMPRLVWIPALFIAATVLSCVAIADGLRDALDPRGKEN